MSHSNVRTLSWFNLAYLLDKDGHQFGLHAENSLPAARPITNHLQRVTIAAVATPYNLIREALQNFLNWPWSLYRLTTQHVLLQRRKRGEHCNIQTESSPSDASD